MLDYAFFPDCGGSDALLFLGNNDDLSALLSVFDIVMTEKVGSLKLSEDVGFRARGRTLTEVSIVKGNNVSRVEVRAGTVANMRWEISVDAGATCKELTAELISYDKPSHQFLECSGEIQIIASLNEYNQGLFRRLENQNFS
jgi:hypothetical protein